MKRPYVVDVSEWHPKPAPASPATSAYEIARERERNARMRAGAAARRTRVALEDARRERLIAAEREREVG